jgi:hypothetical protein
MMTENSINENNNDDFFLQKFAEEEGRVLLNLKKRLFKNPKSPSDAKHQMNFSLIELEEGPKILIQNQRLKNHQNHPKNLMNVFLKHLNIVLIIIVKNHLVL